MNIEILGTLWTYYWNKFQLARDDDRGEVNLTTVILAFAGYPAMVSIIGGI